MLLKDRTSITAMVRLKRALDKESRRPKEVHQKKEIRCKRDNKLQ
jgi:hypothetical protein